MQREITNEVGKKVSFELTRIAATNEVRLVITSPHDTMEMVVTPHEWDTLKEMAAEFNE